MEAQFAAHLTMLNRLGVACDQLSAGARLGARPMASPQLTGRKRE